MPGLPKIPFLALGLGMVLMTLVLLLNALAQSVRGFRLTVHHIHLIGFVLHLTQPTNQLRGIGMCR